MNIWKHPTLRVLWANWKLGVHLALHTRRFGMNNEWWGSFDSVMGRSIKAILWDVLTVKPIIINVKAALFRAYACGLMAPEERIHMEPVVKYLGKFINLSTLDIHLKFTREHYELLPKERRIYD